MSQPRQNQGWLVGNGTWKWFTLSSLQQFVVYSAFNCIKKKILNWKKKILAKTEFGTARTFAWEPNTTFHRQCFKQEYQLFIFASHSYRRWKWVLPVDSKRKWENSTNTKVRTPSIKVLTLYLVEYERCRSWQSNKR